MSRRKGKNMPTSIRIDTQLLEWLSVLRDAQGFPSHAEALRAAILRAHPNIEELVEMARQKEQERKEALGKLIEDEDEQ